MRSRGEFRIILIMFQEIRNLHITVDGKNPANQLRLVVYPIIYRVLYIPDGAGFQLPGLKFPLDPNLYYPPLEPPPPGAKWGLSLRKKQFF